MGAENKKEYRKYFLIDPTQFDHILSLVASKISKQDTLMRKAIEPDLKLGITLRFLATGETFQSLSYQYRVHSTTISHFIPEVCVAIYEALYDNYTRVMLSLIHI